jgi:hypothetical protein
MSKPREFAHLIKNKFGSADNINTLASKKVFSFVSLFRQTVRFTEGVTALQCP